MKLVIGICALDFVATPHYGSLLALGFGQRITDKRLGKPIGTPTILIQQGNIIPDSRRALAEKAIELKATHLLFVDSDIVVPLGALDRLISHHKDVVVGTYNSRYNEHAQLGNRDFAENERPDGLLPMATVPLGFALLKLSIFEKFPRPWFNYLLGPVPGKVRDISEDSWFCKQCRSAGIKIWMDPSIKLGHCGMEIF